MESNAPGPGPDVLVVDNDDSFTGSLVSQCRELGARVRWAMWDEVDPHALHGVDLVLLSPGPGRPADRPVNGVLLREARVPVFGVCLGMQALGEVYGGHVVAARAVLHGKTSPVHHAGAGCFAGLPTPMRATRYHSLAVARRGLPACLEVTAWTEDGEVMGLRHRALPLEGVQFHPESVGTPHGRALLAHVLARAGTRPR